MTSSKIQNPKSKIQPGLLIFCPRRFCEQVTEVSPEELKEMGVDTVLLDLDNTLVGWQRHDVSPEVRQWLFDLKSAGMSLWLISNTKFGRRLRALSAELDIPFIRRAWKPRKKGFLQALAASSSAPHRAVMFGDQMFTDVLGANRVGIYSVMVRPIGRREFIGTKVSRMAESVLMRWFRRRGYL